MDSYELFTQSLTSKFVSAWVNLVEIYKLLLLPIRVLLKFYYRYCLKSMGNFKGLNSFWLVFRTNTLDRKLVHYRHAHCSLPIDGREKLSVLGSFKCGANFPRESYGLVLKCLRIQKIRCSPLISADKPLICLKMIKKDKMRRNQTFWCTPQVSIKIISTSP